MHVHAEEEHKFQQFQVALGRPINSHASDNAGQSRNSNKFQNTEKLKFLGQICVYKRTQQCIKGDGRQGVNYKLAG